MSPSSAPITSGTATINRTLLHSQQFNAHHARNGHARQGLANHFNQGDSPPPTYDDVHDISLQRHGFFILLFPLSHYNSLHFFCYNNILNYHHFTLHFLYMCVHMRIK